MRYFSKMCKTNMDMPKHQKPRISKYGKQMNKTVRYVNDEEEDDHDEHVFCGK